MDGQTSAAGPASSCDALGPRLNSPGPNLETKPGSAICAGSTCIRVLADLSVYCLRKFMHSNLQCATFLQCLLNTHTTAAIGSNTCFFPQPLSPVVVIFLASSATAAVSQGLPGRQLSIYLSIHPSIHLSIYLACLSNCVSSYRPIYLSIYQSINLSIYLSLSLYRTPQIGGVGGTRVLAHSIWKNEIHVPNHQPVIYIYIYIIIISFITVSWAITATFMYSTLPHVRKAPLSPLRHSLASCKPGRDQMVT